ncbi:MAG: prolyl oligopeptidase family serine peptidase [Candidatus Kapabacteria bacterium]|jgi:dipeptidyl aminopeptidase/acylaminoacyl peptidase|nr:prolyl oligopeptidase family serine peptidase [Candidatus Kapabacteria bacterium]
MIFNKLIRAALFTIFFVGLTAGANAEAAKKPFTFDDVMTFKSLRGAKISEDGLWMCWYTQPDRGNPEAFIKATEDTMQYVVKNGASPRFSKDGNWVSLTVKPDVIEAANAKEKPENSLTLVRTETGEEVNIKKVDRSVFSEDSKWLAYKHFGDKKESKENKRTVGAELKLRHLETGSELAFQNVTEFVFDSTSKYIAYVVADPTAEQNGIYAVDLQSGFTFPIKIEQEAKAHYANLVWNPKKHILAFIKGSEDADLKPDSCSLMIWNPQFDDIVEFVSPENIQKDWFMPFNNKVQWTEDYERIFFGLRPIKDSSLTEAKVKFTDTTYYDQDTILSQSDLDVWHWNDERIKPNEKKWWNKEYKDFLFTTVFDTKTQKMTQLADLDLSEVNATDNPNYAIAYDEAPYLKETTWAGWFFDLYIVDIRTGERKLIKKRLEEKAHISPLGKFVIYYYDKAWYIYDTALDSSRNSTINLKVDFFDEDLDEPHNPGSYGFAGWVKDELAAIVYDKYDVWLLYTKGDGILNQTAAAGRVDELTFRVLKLDMDEKYFDPDKEYYLSGFNHKTKTKNIYRFNFRVLGPELILRDDARIDIIARAKNVQKYIITKQRYDLFPDVWVSDTLFHEAEQMSDANPQMKEFKWGSAELVDWTNSVGEKLQGYIVKPDNFDPAKKYPVVVYFYDKFSDYYHRFFMPGINHRPCFPVYTSKDYVMFLPDIKYIIGDPGPSATDCIVSGVNMLIEKGIADPEAVGLWGHSWSAYQAAFIISQTDMFKAAVAGAPVGNMTSAYSGIRLGSGLARQFQYEHFQSRIGGNLWDSLTSYIRNSPVFQAEKINTPLLIMHGDIDEAVPWEQGIEMFLALRRLGKDCVFLQYRGEPHHPRKYENKLDYAKKTLEYYEYYLRKKTPAEWITNGIPYRGK